MSTTTADLETKAIAAAMSRFSRQPQLFAAIKLWGADVQDLLGVKVSAAGRASTVTVQPVLLQLHHDEVQAGQWSRYPARTWTVAVLLDPASGEVLALHHGTPNGKPQAARTSAVNALRRDLEDRVLRPLVAKAVTTSAPEGRVVQDLSELQPGQLIGAHGHGRHRPAVVVQVTAKGTVHYAFTTPTEASNAAEYRRELVVTRGKAKAGQVYV